MKKFLIVLISLVSLFGCKKSDKNFENVLLPNVKSINTSDKMLSFKDSVYIVFEKNNFDNEKISNYLLDLLSSLNIKTSNEKVNSATNIYIKEVQEIDNEAYHLDINDDGVIISAGDNRGVMWAIQSLRQVLPIEVIKKNKAENIELPYLSIKDCPSFPYRGMHLDVCRHFFTVDEVKSYIDLLLMHKFNTFHFHLTDDQGWRVEIKSLPKLTEIGSMRSGTVIKKEWGNYDNIPYGGYFTQEEIKDIVKYAEDRFITVIPEIEMPGHALAALASYPELGCIGKDYETCRSWGVFDDVFCAGNDSVFSFFEKVIDEICVLFPNSPYIHVGGDECPKTRWEECPKCQARMKAENCKDEMELQSYFVHRMEKYINSKGKQIIGWDEILEGGIAPNATIMSWRGYEGGYEAAKQKHNAIMTPTEYCYLDYYQDSTNKSQNEPFSIGGFTDCNEILSWNPIPDSLTDDEKKYIIGVQANIWTEYICDVKHLQYMALPRMIAIAEIAWNNDKKITYFEFNKRFKSIAKIYEALNYNYAKHEINKVLN